MLADRVIEEKEERKVILKNGTVEKWERASEEPRSDLDSMSRLATGK